MVNLGGVGAAAVDVLAAGADVVSGNEASGAGVVIITATVAGAALHLNFADDAVRVGRRAGQVGHVPGMTNATKGASGKQLLLFDDLYEGVANAASHGHHTFPKALGGNPQQRLAYLVDNMHIGVGGVHS